MQRLTRRQIKRQYKYEQVFQTFEMRDYIHKMQFCQPCNGNGCICCSGHGWRHTPESLAFGQGLNAMAVGMNPYTYESRPREWRAFGLGKATRSRIEVRRIRTELGIAQAESDTQVQEHD